MKFGSKTGLHSGMNFCILNPECCILHSACSLNSLIYIGFVPDCRMQNAECNDHLHSGNVIYKSTTYENFQNVHNPLSLREREVNPAYAGLHLQDTVTLAGPGGTV